MQIQNTCGKIEKWNLNNYIIHGIFLRLIETTPPHKPQWFVRDGGVHNTGRLFL